MAEPPAAESLSERGSTVEPTEESAEELFCFRDGQAVRAEAPRCLHPSSFCSFRDSCLVLQAQRDADRLRRGDRPNPAPQ